MEESQIYSIQGAGGAATAAAAVVLLLMVEVGAVDLAQQQAAHLCYWTGGRVRQRRRTGAKEGEDTNPWLTEG